MYKAAPLGMKNKKQKMGVTLDLYISFQRWERCHFSCFSFLCSCEGGMVKLKDSRVMFKKKEFFLQKYLLIYRWSGSTAFVISAYNVFMIAAATKAVHLRFVVVVCQSWSELWALSPFFNATNCRFYQQKWGSSMDRYLFKLQEQKFVCNAQVLL